MALRISSLFFVETINRCLHYYLHNSLFFLCSWIIPDTTVEVCVDKLIEAVNDLGEKEKMHVNKVKHFFSIYVSFKKNVGCHIEEVSFISAGDI